MQSKSKYALPFFLIAALVFPTSLLVAQEEADPKKEEKTETNADEGPDHNVTLNEEEEVTILLNKARKAREEAVQKPTVWPKCVEAYAKILEQFPNTVYLHKWDNGKTGDSFKYGLGVYRSTLDKVNYELATLPKAGLAVYRAANDGQARSLMVTGLKTMDERNLEKVAQIYFNTSWGDDALYYLAELAYNNGSYRQAVINYNKLEKHPDTNIPLTVRLTRVFFCNLKLGRYDAAQQTLDKLTESVKGGQASKFSIGKLSGDAALQALSEQLAKGKQTTTVAQSKPSAPGLSTYFGNATHTAKPIPRKKRGVLRWSYSINSLLGLPEKEDEPETVTRSSRANPLANIKLFNNHLTVRDGFLYLAGTNIIACHSIHQIDPKRPQFLYPTYAQAPVSNNTNARSYRNSGRGIYWHPYFATLGEDHLYITLGPEAIADMYRSWGGRGGAKSQPNWIVALGKKKGGKKGIESGSLKWSIEPNGINKNISAEMKEWLSKIRFASTPTFSNGALFVLAVSDSGNNRESWAVSLSAETGQVLWKTLISTASPTFFQNPPVQPDLGLPVAVKGGSLYAVTNTGSVAALDTATGAIKWIRIYDRIVGQNNHRGMVATGDIWGPNPPIIHNNVVICTPQDSKHIYAFETDTGYLAWEMSRFEKDESGNGLKHVLGILHDKYLVLSGKEILTVETSGGRKRSRANLDHLTIRGKGVLSEDKIFVPTVEGIQIIEGHVPKGSNYPSCKILASIPWTNPETEPGNLFLADNIMFSVSDSHVSAYSDLEEVEKTLNAQILKNTKDCEPYLELGDLYTSDKNFEKALATYQKGIEIAKTVLKENEKDEKVKALLDKLQNNKFESFFKAGLIKTLATIEAVEKDKDVPAGYEYFKKAKQEAQGSSHSVRALWKLSETALTLEKPKEAVDYLQELISKFGKETFHFGDEKNTIQAAVYGQDIIKQIKKDSPEALVKYEAAAKKVVSGVLTSTDPATIEKAIAHYPNADIAAEAILKLAVLYLKADKPYIAGKHLRRFRIDFMKHPKVHEGLALLTLAYEKAENIGSAKVTLRRLLRTKGIGTAQITLLEGTQQSAKSWAETKAKETGFTELHSDSFNDLGDGVMQSQAIWTASCTSSETFLKPKGKTPKAWRNHFLAVDNDQLIIREGISGKEALAKRLQLPEKFNESGKRARWVGNLLVVLGDKELVAYDTTEEGKEAWRIRYRENPNHAKEAITALLGSDTQVVLVNGNGKVAVVDTLSGKDAWSKDLVDLKVRNTKRNGLNISERAVVRIGGAGGRFIINEQLTQGRFNGLTVAPLTGSELFIGDGIMVQAVEDLNKIRVTNLDSGLERFTLPSNIGPLIKMTIYGDTIYAAGSKKIVAVDGYSGKLLWEFELGKAPIHLKADPDRVVAILNDLQAVVLKTEIPLKGSRLLFKTLSPTTENMEARNRFAGARLDGRQLFVGVKSTSNKREVMVHAYNASGGKFLWKEPIASANGNLNMLIAKKNLAFNLFTSNDAGQTVSAIGIRDRETGSLKWVRKSVTDQVHDLAVFEGGLVARNFNRVDQVSGFVSKSRNLIKPDQILADATTDDPRLKIKKAVYLFEQGKVEEAITNLEDVLSQESPNNEIFGLAFEKLSQIRAFDARNQKFTLSFKTIATAPTIDGKLEDWSKIPETSLGKYRYLFLPGEVDRNLEFTPDAWKGAEDLQVSYRGAHDDKNIYLGIVVKDNEHAQDRASDSGFDLWKGDSLQLAFDLEKDERSSFFGNDFELGIALNEKGEMVTWRWVEKSRYIQKKWDVTGKVVRDETAKTTTYELAIPLEYLGIKKEKELSFGFTFVVNDRDTGDEQVEKGIGPSPGIWDPKDPSRYSLGKLE